MPEPAAAFAAHFGVNPTARVDAPGRVNLMGDHIDYNGLSVLPMALQRRVTLLLRPRPDPVVRIASTKPEFEAREFTVTDSLTALPPGDWGNYAMAAIQELVSDTEGRAGFDALVHSDIPVAAGLSSSSALVVAFARAFLFANGREMPTLELAERMAEAEHFTGTRGGGMDQAICLGAREGAACRIDFDPLHLHCHVVPPGWTFLVAASGVRAEKSGVAREAYNTRTAECREAIQIVNGALGLAPESSWRDLIASNEEESLFATAREMLPALLFRRFRHVVTEAERVGRCGFALERAAFDAFGQMLSESHLSLAQDYEVSIPELDALVHCAVDAGAAGARLTGAGFGGCVVALCRAEQAASVRQVLAEQYFAPRAMEASADVLFVARPGGGARVTPLSRRSR